MLTPQTGRTTVNLNIDPRVIGTLSILTDQLKKLNANLGKIAERMEGDKPEVSADDETTIELLQTVDELFDGENVFGYSRPISQLEFLLDKPDDPFSRLHDRIAEHVKKLKEKRK